MSKNRLQVIYNHLERECAAAEEIYLRAEKSRHAMQQDYETILATVKSAVTSLAPYPQAPSVKRMRLIQTLLQKLLMTQVEERRTLSALGFLLGRLKNNLANEMLEPRLYAKIREAIKNEAATPEPVAIGTTQPAQKSIRLMLICRDNLHFAIPVLKIVRKTVTTGNGQQITYIDLKGERKTTDCDTYFTPVEIPRRMLPRMAEHRTVEVGGKPVYRTSLQFYGRHFFLYGARLSYTVRPGVRSSAHTTHSPAR